MLDIDPRISQASRADMDKADRIRTLNDAFRRDPRDGGVMFTSGVRQLPATKQATLLLTVRTFDGFTPEDDPYDEHDFAAVTLDGERYLWKIDYFDLDLRHRSPDPSDPSFTVRVLTVMRADEY